MKDKILAWLYDLGLMPGWMPVKEYNDAMIDDAVMIGHFFHDIFLLEKDLALVQKENRRLSAELKAWKPIIKDIRFKGFHYPKKKKNKRITP